MLKRTLLPSLLIVFCSIVACKNEPKTNADTVTQSTNMTSPSVDSSALAAQAQATADSLAAAKAAMAQKTADEKAVPAPVAKDNAVVPSTKTTAKPKTTTVTPVKPAKMTTVKPEPKFDNGNIFKRPGRDDVFKISEIAPAYPGGEKAMMKYLEKNIKYPMEAKDKNIQGTVFLEFVVEKDGRVDDVLVNKGVNPLLDKEAVRVVNSMPRWTPGKQNGNLVAVRYSIPVKFELITN